MHDFASNPLFELAPVAYSVLDTDLVQVAANRQFFRLFGYPTGAMTSSAQLTHPDDAERTRLYLDQLLDGLETSASIEKRYVRADGSAFWGRLTATVVEIRGRRVLLGVIEDIQTQHDLLHDLSEQADLRSKFVSQVSHELRNPLHLISGTSELLTQAPIPMKHRQQAAGILREATSLAHLVDDLLDIGRSDAGRLALEDDVFSTRSLVDRIRQTVAEMALEKGLAFEVDVEEAVPVHVAGDEGRLRQILVNLASNAVKFTARGSVTLDVDLDQDRLVRFRVRDTGPGIPEEGLKTIFEPFVRFSRSESGAGLGLAIASRLATLLGGTLTVSNLDTGGTEFELCVPLSEATPPIDVSKPRRQRRHSGSSTGNHILIVEDNVENQLLASAQLETLGFTSEIAPDGYEALDLLASGTYDAVLMDWHLPGMDGLETTRRLRTAEASGNGPRVPVIALTARAMAADVEACLDAGADDHIAKPASLDTLRSLLRRWIQEVPGSNDSTSESTALADRDAMVSLFDNLGDVEIVSSIVFTYLDELDGRVRRILDAESPESVESAAHVLGSTSSIVGATLLHDIAREIERLVRQGEPIGPSLRQQLAEVAAATATSVNSQFEDLRSGT